MDRTFQEIKSKYISEDLENDTPPSLDDLAEEFGVDITILKVAAKQQNWDAYRRQRRERFLAKVEEEDNRQLEAAAIDLARERNKMLRSRLAVSDMINDILVELKAKLNDGAMKPSEMIKFMALALAAQESLFKLFVQLERQLAPDPTNTDVSKFLDDLAAKAALIAAANQDHGAEDGETLDYAPSFDPELDQMRQQVMNGYT